MSLQQRLADDLKKALKSGDRQRIGVLRMLKARILDKEVELRTSKGRDYRLDDEEVRETLRAYAKQRRQSVEAYQEAGRADLAANEQAEMELVSEYLPKAPTPERIQEIVEQTATELNAAGPRDFGRVMKEAMARLEGSADGRQVSEIVRRVLDRE
jgi:uncharacterized protein